MRDDLIFFFVLLSRANHVAIERAHMAFGESPRVIGAKSLKGYAGDAVSAIGG
jgi:hypothetical protein